MSEHWATAEEIAKLKGWSVGYVPVLAHRNHWRRRGRRPVQYCLEDLATYLARPRRSHLIRTDHL